MSGEKGRPHRYTQTFTWEVTSNAFGHWVKETVEGSTYSTSFGPLLGYGNVIELIIERKVAIAKAVEAIKEDRLSGANQR